MTVIIGVFSVLYVVLGVGIFFRLADICRHPECYRESELEAAARKKRQKRRNYSFEDLSFQYIVLSLVLTLLLTVAAYGIIAACAFWSAGGDQVILLDNQFIGVLAAFFLNIVVGILIIPLHAKTKLPDFPILDVLDASDRQANWKEGYIFLLMLFLITFPFYGLACNNYAYYNETGITVSRYFQMDETYTPYGEIQEVVIHVHHNKQGRVSVFQYELELADGRRFDINDGAGAKGCVTETTLEVHKLLEQNANCVPTITPLNEVDMEYLKTCSAEQAEAIRYIFEGFHREQ